MHRIRMPAAWTALFATTLVLAGWATQAPASTATSDDAPRIVAMADLHGDLAATRAALRLAGAIDTLDAWIGGDLVLVQTGDILDRGDDEEAIMQLFRRLRTEAAEAGGAVHMLNGNHELMNAYLDFRYVTPGGYADFEGTPENTDSVLAYPILDSIQGTLQPQQLARAKAFRPGGTYARLLAEQNTIVIIGKTVFVHGGILPHHLELGVDGINQEIQAWLRGEVPQPLWVRGPTSPVWTRLYSRNPDALSCDTLVSVLDALDVDRMVMGHSVQRGGITAYCGGRAWSIDVGMAAHYRGRTGVLEIRGDVVRGLR